MTYQVQPSQGQQKAPAKPPFTGVPQEVTCIVCGAKSHREDWQGLVDVACDSHTPAEIAQAKSRSASAPTVGKPAGVPGKP
jgi:RNA polymerase subunit RPABC4/transcription elongation factor Spt4